MGTFEQPETFEREESPENLKLFKELLRKGGWRTSPDGGDFCGADYGRYLSQFEGEEREMIKKESRKTADLAEWRANTNEGWYVHCEKCDRSIFQEY
jgi:RNA polymerase-binding transcription factor DksA